MTARHVHGARQVRLLELVLLANVDHHVAVVAVRDQLVDLARVYFRYLAPDLANQVCAAGHRVETPKSRSVFTSLSVATQQWIEVPRRAPRNPRPKACCGSPIRLKLPSTVWHVFEAPAWGLHRILQAGSALTRHRLLAPPPAP